MASEELSIRISARDEFSAQAADATRAAKRLADEIKDVRAEVARTGKGGDNLDRLQSEFEQLTREAAEARAEARRLGREMKNTGTQGAASAKQATTAWGKFKKAMASPLAMIASTAAVTLFAKQSIQAFAEVQDASDALSASFGPSGERMIAWANETAIAFNLSRGEALKSAQMMAVFGDSAGLAGEELETFAISLTERAAEAASYFGGTTADAITAFGAAMRGEMEPARRYGILLDDATLRTKAFEMGLISTTTQALTPQQKTLAAYNAVMEQTTRVQGDVARTADSMGNQIKQSQAQMENLKAAVGESLALALGPLLGMLNGALETFNALPQPIKTIATAIGAVAAAALILGPRLAMMGVTLDGIKAKAIGATNAMFGMSKGAARAGLAIAAYSAAAMAAGQANGGTGVVLSRVSNLNDALRQMTADGGIEGLAKRFKNFDAAVGDAAAFGSIDTRAEQSARMLAQLDSEMTNLVASGNASAAERQFNALTDAAEEWGGSVDEVTRALPNYTSTLEGATAAAKRHSPAANAVATATQYVIDAARRAVPVVDEDAQAMGRAATAASILRDAKRGAARASDGLTRALDGVTAAVQRAEAMRAYNAALKEYVENPTNQTLEAVSTAMTSAADSMENPRKKAKFVASAVGEIEEAGKGAKLNPELLTALDNARTKALNFKSAWDSIQLTKTLTIYINKVGNIPLELASGGMVDHHPLAAPRARGLLVGPGSGTSDSIPARLSNGEFVVRAAAVKAIGVGNMYALNRADQRPVYVAPKMTAPTLAAGPTAPVSTAPTIGEVVINNPSSGIDVQAEVLWAMRRAERLQRERA
jgi:hypothetical protein